MLFFKSVFKCSLKAEMGRIRKQRIRIRIRITSFCWNPNSNPNPLKFAMDSNLSAKDSNQDLQIQCEYACVRHSTEYTSMCSRCLPLFVQWYSLK